LLKNADPEDLFKALTQLAEDEGILMTAVTRTV